MTTTLLTACGFVHSGGIGGTHAPLGRRPGPNLRQPALRWSDFAGRPYDHFGRLDLLSQYSLAAVEMLGIDGAMGSDASVILVTRLGCLSVDIDFCQSIASPTGPSPALFSYTLPSMAVGEIAIRHGIHGHSVCLMGGPGDASLALWEGLNLIADGEAKRCVCVACDAIRQDSAAAAALLGQARDVECCAYAFLLEADDACTPEHRSLAVARIDRGTSADAPADAAGLEVLRRLRDFLMMATGNQRLELSAPRCLRTRGVITVERRPPGR